MNVNVWVYIAVMAGVTYIIRMVPFTVFRRKIKSRFINDMLYYIPYAVLAAMTVPAVFFSTGDIITSSVGAATAVVLAYFGLPLIAVALSASAAAYVAGLVVPMLIK